MGTDQGKADTIRQWFEQQFKNSVGDPLVPFTGEPRPLLQPITTEEIERARKSLRNGRGTGPDRIQNELWKYVGDAFSTAISHTINTVYETHTPLDAVGRGILVPLPKPKKQLGPVFNLRAIELLNIIRKILSTVVLRRIQHKVNLFTGPCQSGFKQGRSCADIVWAQRILVSVVMSRH